MAEEAGQDGVGTWRSLERGARHSVLTMLRTKKQFAADRAPFQAAADALEELSDHEVLRLTREVVEAYAALHEHVVYQTRCAYVTADVQHALDKLEQLGIVSAAGRGVHPATAIVKTLSKALDRHKAHGAAGLAEMAAEQIADLQRQLRAYDTSQRVLQKILDRWKALALKRKRELKKLRRRVAAEEDGEAVALRFWLTELVDAASSGSGPSPRAVVARLNKQFPGWRG